MKTVVRISTLILLILLFRSAPLAQSEPTVEDDWVRLGSDNGEFSIQIPQGYSYFYNKEGFETTYRNSPNKESTYSFKQMSIVNTYSAGILFSIEAYETRKEAIAALTSLDRTDSKLVNIKFRGVDAKEAIERTDQFYSVKRYLCSKNFLYVVSAATRGDRKPAIDRFFESIYFRPDSVESGPPVRRFSRLQVSRIEINTKDVQPILDTSKDQLGNEMGRLLIVAKVRPAYTMSARMNGVQGVVIARLKFGLDGSIRQIGIVKGLPDGLVGQVVFAVLRMKFLPEERSGKPIDIEKQVEYGFALY